MATIAFEYRMDGYGMGSEIGTGAGSDRDDGYGCGTDGRDVAVYPSGAGAASGYGGYRTSAKTNNGDGSGSPYLTGSGELNYTGFGPGIFCGAGDERFAGNDL